MLRTCSTTDLHPQFNLFLFKTRCDFKIISLVTLFQMEKRKPMVAVKALMPCMLN
jgi:hypothetical protein